MSTPRPPLILTLQQLAAERDQGVRQEIVRRSLHDVLWVPVLAGQWMIAECHPHGTVVLGFTSTAAMGRWRSEVRSETIAFGDLLRQGLPSAAVAMVLDLAGPTSAVLDKVTFRKLSNHRPSPMCQDGDTFELPQLLAANVVSGVLKTMHAEPDVTMAYLVRHAQTQRLTVAVRLVRLLGDRALNRLADRVEAAAGVPLTVLTHEAHHRLGQTTPPLYERGQ